MEKDTIKVIETQYETKMIINGKSVGRVDTLDVVDLMRLLERNGVIELIEELV